MDTPAQMGDKITDAKLSARGILTAAQVAGWSSGLYYGRPGWFYPVYDLNGQTITRRWKNATSEGMKYAWPDGKQGAECYIPSRRFLTAIQESGGVVWIANGEPSALAFVAAGFDNVFCWFGENSPPATLAANLLAWGATEVRYPADNDDPGRESAAKVRDLLADTGISFKALSWGDVAEKYDANDLWIDCAFDPAEFVRRLHLLDALILRREQPQTEATYDWSASETDPDLVAALARALGVSGWATNTDGWTRKKIANPLVQHSNDHKNPGSSFNMHTGVLKDHKGGSHSPFELAVHFGIETTHYKRPAPQRRWVDDTGKLLFDPYPLPGLAADVTGCKPHMSDLDIPAGDVLLIGDMGTGKTTWAADQGVNTAPTHRVALSRALADALSKSGHIMEHYQGLTGAQLRQVPNLSICLNSLTKALDRVPGVLFIDEIRQLLAHLGGDTFSGSEAESTYNTLKAQIRRARRLLAADAHADQITIDWLKHLRPDLKIVVNTYARPRGPLTVWQHKAGLQAKVWTLADQDAGPVVIVTGSKALARDLEAAAQARYGEVAVMAVYQDVANERDRRAFLQNINAQIGNYRVVIFSPTVGSGIDIQTGVRAVIGFFMAEPLTAPDCHQQLNRCRNTQETHVYIQEKDLQREIDPLAIFRQALENARQTGMVAHFDENGLPVFTDSQRELQWLLARIEAADNASKNRLYDHFLTIARGYSRISYSDTTDVGQRELMAEQRQVIRDMDKERTLSASPVSRQTWQLLIETGEVTREQQYGYIRWKIEQCAGQDINSVNYDLLRTEAGRAALYFLADHRHAALEVLADLDRGEHDSLPGKRHHYTRRKILFDDLIKRVFGPAGLDNREMIPAAHIREVVSDFLTVSGDELRRLFQRRADLSKDPIWVLRGLLKKVGLRLENKQVRDGDGFTRMYWLEQASLTDILELAESCHLARERRRAERLEAKHTPMGVCQNTDSSYSTIRILTHAPPQLPYLSALTEPTALTTRW